MLSAYKFRLSPTIKQSEFLDRNFGACRFVWNQFVSSFNKSVVGPYLPQNEKYLKDIPAYSFLNGVISYALQQKRIDFDQTKKQYFSKIRKKKLGRPSFKKKGVSNDSFRIPYASMSMNSVDLDNGRLKLPKMSSIKMIVDRRFSGEIKSVTVSKNKCNQYFVSILVETKKELKPTTGKVVGIDLGFKDLATLSDGIKFTNPKLFRETQSKLKVAQQHLSRKVYGSNRYIKQKYKVAKIHQKISNQRNFIHHNLSTWLVENYDVIILEDLNVAGMKKLLGKSTSDASLASLITMIEYKCEWYGKTFHKIDRFYPSSKLCSCCGIKNANLKLSDRTWKCENCNTVLDRDLNASYNILNKGLIDLYSFTSEELSDYRRGESVNPQGILNSLKVDSMKRLANFINLQ